MSIYKIYLVRKNHTTMLHEGTDHDRELFEVLDEFEQTANITNEDELLVWTDGKLYVMDGGSLSDRVMLIRLEAFVLGAMTLYGYISMVIPS